MALKDILEIVESMVTSLAILIGGWWTLKTFVIKRDAYPKVQFDIDLKPICIQDNQILIEIELILENKGLVRHKIDIETFYLKIRYLNADDSIKNGDSQINFQTNFPHILKIATDDLKDKTKERKILSKAWEFTFVDPGIIQKYNHVTSVPIQASCILLNSKFKYNNEESDFHGAQKVFYIDKLKIPVSSSPSIN